MNRMLKEPLTNRFAILIILNRMARAGVPAENVDTAIVRRQPVDLDLLQECKRQHPAYGRDDTRR